TFADDVSGLQSVKLYWRTDKDSLNPISSIQNETYAGGSEVNAWNIETMTGSWDPSVKGPDNIVPTPTCRAQMFKANVIGANNVLVDYFVEASDTKGNTNRSDIMHVFVGQYTATNSNPVIFNPSTPTDCNNLATRYTATGRTLSNASPVFLKITFNNFATAVSNFQMAALGGGIWVFTNTIPGGTTNVIAYFSSDSGGGGTVDNNGGGNWQVTVTHCSTPAATTFVPAAPNGCDPVLIRYQPNEGVLSNASPVSIHVGFNEWQGVPNPDPAMTNHTGVWEYWYYPPAGAYKINCCFNNGGAIWENNNGQNYSVAVSNCVSTNITVLFSPSVPTDCGTLTVQFDPSGTPLLTSNRVFVTMTFDGWSHYTHNEMGLDNGKWLYSSVIPDGTRGVVINFRGVSNDTTYVYDNAGLNWSVNVSVCTTGSLSTIRFAPASPHINAGGTPNNVGDNFNMNTAGGAAVTKGSTGFGGFGRVYVNYDATNFYVGAEGVDTVGTNNGMIIFLEFNTLSDNAGNLWNMNDKDPKALDKLHNVAFYPQMDLAIVLGDVWGDGTFTNFNLGGDITMPFGQGVFYLSASSSNFWPLNEARLSQFDGTGTNACASAWDSGSRLTTRWECSIPWANLNAPQGVESISNAYIAGLIVSSSVSNNDRYISGKFLGDTSTSGTKDEWGSYGYNFVILNGMRLERPSGDFNGNGIPDEWERFYFGDWYVPTSNSDFDQDGTSDLKEYVASTDPKDFVSCFEAFDFTPNRGGDGVIVHWSSIGGKQYDVFTSTNLLPNAGELIPLATNVSATPPENAFTNASPDAALKFYWIKTGR
ncbi:MAG: hypothetical protein V2A34_04770, partial [Lentisphaerota bacterium]